MTEEQRRTLEAALWNCANVLRNSMDADEFRNYILGFIFYKYLSERLHAYADKILKNDGIVFADIDEHSKEGKAYLKAVEAATVDSLGYFLKPSELFLALATRAANNTENDNEETQQDFILEDLSNIFDHIEASTLGTASEDDFDHLFDDIDLTSMRLGRTDNAKNTLISKLIIALQRIDFEYGDKDVLGDAYEYLIGKFAAGAGKTAGEFYTPQSVSTIMARLVTTDKNRLKSVYDPTCGSGSLLLRVMREIGNPKKIGEIFGQERNRTTYNLARMNMLLHGVHYSEFDIKQGDTLEDPRHDEDARYEAIVANPPFSAQWTAREILRNDPRFSNYGVLPPSSKADYAFVLHMIHRLDDGGQMAVILPHGALFRGGTEGQIRKHLIKKMNVLDAVIGLPANVFFGTSIPACILVFKKCREHEKDVFFIDASNDFEKVGNKNQLRDKDIDKIVNTYRNRRAKKKYARRVPIKEIVENDYNLNIPRYVDTSEEEEPIDLKKVAEEVIKIDKAMVKTDKTIQAFCKELKIKSPV